MSDQQREWDELAELDAEWAILTSPDKRGGGWDRDEFLALGRQQVGLLLDAISPYDLPAERRTALDFGCGLGRMTRALSDHFDAVLGLDISTTMVDGARRLNADRPNCRFEVNPGADLGQISSDTYDLVLSFIVLQHVPQREVVLDYVAEFVRVLAPGGIACFQIPTRVPWWARLQVRRNLYRALRRLRVSPARLHRLGLNPMAMSGVGRDLVCDTVQRSGGTILKAASDPRPGDFHASFYYVTKDAGLTPARPPAAA